jgi:4-amino-4-deoxy-L-arabinose transferase-like glycosyltransferase
MSGTGALHRNRWIVIVLAICALLYFLRLGEVAFLGKDEPKNAQAAREMLRSGDWVVTTLEGETWFDKPILYYWTALLGYGIFGVGELGARAGPAVAGLLAVWLTFLLGRRALAPVGCVDRSGGALAALILGTGVFFFYYARTAVTDSLLTAAVTGTLTAFFLARQGSHPRRCMYAAWACAALAVLAKGPVGLLLPALVVGADLLWRRPRGALRQLHLPGGLLVFLAIAGPWHLLVMLRSGGQFLDDFILHRNVARFATENLPHPGPIWYYLPVLLLAGFPWSLFLPGALMRLLRGWKALPREERDRMRFLLLWILLPTVFFSFAGSKLPSYLLPAFPAVAVILARELRFLIGAATRAARLALGAGLLLFVVFSLGVVAGGWYYLSEREPHLLGAAAPFFAVLAGASLGAVAAVALRRRRAVLPLLTAAAVLVPLVIVLTVPQALEGRVSAREIARRALALEPGPGQLLSYRFYDNSFFFYTDSRVLRLYEPRWIEGRLREVGGQALCFVRRFDLPEVLGYEGFDAEDLGSVEEIHLLRLTLAGPPAPSPGIPGPQGP